MLKTALSLLLAHFGLGIRFNTTYLCGVKCDQINGEWCEFWDPVTQTQVEPYCTTDPCADFECDKSEICESWDVETDNPTMPYCMPNPCNCSGIDGYCEFYDEVHLVRVKPYCREDPCSVLDCNFTISEYCVDWDEFNDMPMVAECRQDPCYVLNCDYEKGYYCTDWDYFNNVPMEPVCQQDSCFVLDCDAKGEQCIDWDEVKNVPLLEPFCQQDPCDALNCNLDNGERCRNIDGEWQCVRNKHIPADLDNLPIDRFEEDEVEENTSAACGLVFPNSILTLLSITNFLSVWNSF